MVKVLSILLFLAVIYGPCALGFNFEPLNIEYNPEIEQKNCSSVDLRTEFESRNIPDRRDQDTTGWCYAFVVADLLSFKYGVNVSPSDIARQAVDEYANLNVGRFSLDSISPAQANTPLGGGHINFALNVMKGKGIVLDQDCPSEDVAITEIERNSINAKKRGESLIEVSEVCLSKDQYQSLFPSEKLQPLYDIISNNEFKRVLRKMAQGSCHVRHHIGNELEYESRWHADEGTTKEDVIEFADEALSSHKIVGIAYDKAVLVKPTSSTGSRIDHASSIVGRRYNPNKGRCEFLIRNTESGCSMYLNDYDCENNHVWIPRGIMKKGIGGAYSVN